MGDSLCVHVPRFCAIFWCCVAGFLAQGCCQENRKEPDSNGCRIDENLGIWLSKLWFWGFLRHRKLQHSGSSSPPLPLKILECSTLNTSFPKWLLYLFDRPLRCTRRVRRATCLNYLKVKSRWSYSLQHMWCFFFQLFMKYMCACFRPDGRFDFLRLLDVLLFSVRSFLLFLFLCRLSHANKLKYIYTNM